MLTQLHTMCLALARVIDEGVAKNEVPVITRDLPEALKQVCKRKHDGMSKSMIMILLFSARTACKLGWFSEDDAREVSKLVNEMLTDFCGPTGADVGSGQPESSLVPTIMHRFYPSLRLGKMLASLEVKPGYGTYFCDFHIMRDDFSHSEKETVRLLVARIDITETSSCLVSPQQVNFLVNGAPVGSRTCADMIPGPQLPTDVTPMLKYGTNLLQAFGKFDGPCVILVAFMSAVNEHDSSSLPRYIPSNAAAVPVTAADSDLIEGPSRISLKCPVSRRRIKLPVKGHSCKHPQCFDFGNYVDMNSRRPSWRCPHCNQCVCYLDIRVDLTLAKILQEVGDDIAEVVISADGLWWAVLEINDDESLSKYANGEKNENGQVGIAGPMVNLTDVDEQMDVDPVAGTEDKKALQSDPPSGTGSVNPELAGGQDSAIAGSLNVPPLPSNLVLDVPTSNVTSRVDLSAVNLPPPLILTVPNHCGQSTGGPSFQEALLPATSAGFASLPLGVNAYAFDVEYGHVPNLRPMNITRVPIAVQALPVPSQIRKLAAQRERSTANQSIPNVYPVQNLQQQPVLRPCPQVASSYGPSTTMLSHSSNTDLQQCLNQFLSTTSRTHSPPVGQPRHMNIQNPLNSVDQQASPSLPSRLAAVHSQIQGFATPIPSGPAASSAMISEQNLLPTGRMRGSLSGRVLENLGQLIIRPTQVALPAGQPSGSPPSTQPTASPNMQKNR